MVFILPRTAASPRSGDAAVRRRSGVAGRLEGDVLLVVALEDPGEPRVREGVDLDELAAPLGLGYDLVEPGDVASLVRPLARSQRRPDDEADDGRRHRGVDEARPEVRPRPGDLRAVEEHPDDGADQHHRGEEDAVASGTSDAPLDVRDQFGRGLHHLLAVVRQVVHSDQYSPVLAVHHGDPPLRTWPTSLVDSSVCLRHWPPKKQLLFTRCPAQAPLKRQASNPT